MTGNSATYYLARHAMFVLISLIAAALVFQVPLRVWQQLAPFLFLAGLALLALVLIPGIGREVGGQSRQDVCDRAIDRLSASENDTVRRLAIKRVALLDQRLDASPGVAGTKKRARPVASQPLPEVTHPRLQIHHEALAVEQRAALGIQHGAAARGKHTTRGPREFRDQLRFATAKAGLSLEFEDSRDRNTTTPFEHGICVDKRAAECRGKPPADGGFS